MPFKALFFSPGSGRFSVARRSRSREALARCRIARFSGPSIIQAWRFSWQNKAVRAALLVMMFASVITPEVC